MKTMICGLNETPGWEHTITAMAEGESKYPIIHGMLRMVNVKETLRLIVDLHVFVPEGMSDDHEIGLGKQMVLDEYSKLMKRVFFREPGSDKIMVYIPKSKPDNRAWALSADFLL